MSPDLEFAYNVISFNKSSSIVMFYQLPCRLLDVGENYISMMPFRSVLLLILKLYVFKTGGVTFMQAEQEMNTKYDKMYCL